MNGFSVFERIDVFTRVKPIGLPLAGNARHPRLTARVLARRLGISGANSHMKTLFRKVRQLGANFCGSPLQFENSQ